MTTIFCAAGIDRVVGQHRTPEAVLEAARQGDFVIVQSVRPLLTRTAIEQIDYCPCIVRLGIGCDSVDMAAATEQGIPVCNAPNCCIDGVADHALALLLGSVRHLVRQDRWIRDGRWDRTKARSARRIKGCTLGLIGFGRIARAIVELKVDVDELLSRSDFVSGYSPLTEETHHLLGSRESALMKEGVFLVNISRGPIVKEAV